MAGVQQIMDRLEHIESDLKFIKKHISDIDLVLTEDDLDALDASDKDLKAGRTKRL